MEIVATPEREEEEEGLDRVELFRKRMDNSCSAAGDDDCGKYGRYGCYGDYRGDGASVSSDGRGNSSVTSGASKSSVTSSLAAVLEPDECASLESTDDEESIENAEIDENHNDLAAVCGRTGGRAVVGGREGGRRDGAEKKKKKSPGDGREEEGSLEVVEVTLQRGVEEGATTSPQDENDEEGTTMAQIDTMGCLRAAARHYPILASLVGGASNGNSQEVMPAPENTDGGTRTSVLSKAQPPQQRGKRRRIHPLKPAHLRATASVTFSELVSVREIKRYRPLDLPKCFYTAEELNGFRREYLLGMASGKNMKCAGSNEYVEEDVFEMMQELADAVCGCVKSAAYKMIYPLAGTSGTSL